MFFVGFGSYHLSMMVLQECSSPRLSSGSSDRNIRFCLESVIFYFYVKNIMYGYRGLEKRLVKKMVWMEMGREPKHTPRPRKRARLPLILFNCKELIALNSWSTISDLCSKCVLSKAVILFKVLCLSSIRQCFCLNFVEKLWQFWNISPLDSL